MHGWSHKYKEHAYYIFELRDERDQTPIWGFAFSLHYIASITIAEQPLQYTNHPYKSVLTYKFSQGHNEALLKKSVDVVDGKIIPMYWSSKNALRRRIIWNSIEPSKTGNCTSFDDLLSESNGKIDFSTKQWQHSPHFHIKPNDPDTVDSERMMIHLDDEFLNVLRDNIQYYSTGYKYVNCKAQLLLNFQDPKGFNMSSYPLFARIPCFKQNGGLIYPSPAILRL